MSFPRLQPSPLTLSSLSLSLAFFLALTAINKVSSARLFTGHPPDQEQIQKAPRNNIKDLIPYPRDALPGGRDVDTPYGTIRVFEWGPEDGRKVLLVHGISTPGIALAPLAEKLVEKGCRVMLFDLFGRGHSDDPPSTVSHTPELYNTQILFVLTSSPLRWLTPLDPTNEESTEDNGGFDLIGYSLGGGISANFARWHPRMVRSLILIAPAGILRSEKINWRMKLMYSAGLFPEWLVRRWVKWVLFPDPNRHAGPNIITTGTTGPRTSTASDESTDRFDSTCLSLLSTPAPSPHLTTHPLYHPSSSPTGIPITSILHHQLHTHPAFLSAFISSFRHGPIYNQHPIWRSLGSSSPNANPKTLIILSTTDPVISHTEIIQDATAAFGEEPGGKDWRWDLRVLDGEKVGGHDVIFTREGSREIGEQVWDFWNRVG